MNRRIKRNRAVPIHITLAPGLLDEIDARLSHKMSRSNWIRGACEMKLAGEDEFSIADVPLFQLMAAVAARTDDESLKVLLYNKIKESQAKKNPHSLNDIKWKGPPTS